MKEGNLDEFEIEKKLKIKGKKAKNPKTKSIFSLLGKPSNFDKKVELNEHTSSLFIFVFKIIVYYVCYAFFKVIYYF
jgi:hypothetical protein